MNPRQTREQNRFLRTALKVLEKDEKQYARAEMVMHDRIAIFDPSRKSAPHRSSELLRLALDVLTIRAEAYLSLVTDLESQKAFTRVITECGILAREAYMGIERMFFINHQRVPEIDDCVDHWINEGYRRDRLVGFNPRAHRRSQTEAKASNRHGTSVPKSCELACREVARAILEFPRSRKTWRPKLEDYRKDVGGCERQRRCAGEGHYWS